MKFNVKRKQQKITEKTEKGYYQSILIIINIYEACINLRIAIQK